MGLDKYNRQKSPACRNCLFVCWNVNKDNPANHKRNYFCGGKYNGLPLYPFDICDGYKKRYHRNRQLDINDMQEENKNE